MRIYRVIERILLRMISFVWCLFVGVHERKNIKRKKVFLKSQKLTQEQKRLVDEFYKKHYGRKISYKWHRLYQSYTGNFDYRYFPEYLFTTKLEPIDNKRIQVLPLENKALLSNFTDGMGKSVRIPTTYLSCVGGRLYDGEGNIIGLDEAIHLLKTIKNGCYQAICKKTVDTSSGRDVRLLHIVEGIDQIESESIDKVVSSMGDNFVVQEKIEAHPALAALYAGSINTIRVVTYQTSTQFKTAPIIMRIGKTGYVDNAHAGGMFIGVTDEGVLLKEAFTEYHETYHKHPISNVVFEGYQLPCVPEIIRVAIQMHKKYPSMRFISWDFTVDKDENIVLIEANLHSQTIWFSQIAHGKSFFGDDTAEMLRLVRVKN